MSGGASVYTGGEILDLLLRAQAATFPATMYMRLLVTPTSRVTPGTETSYGAYARLALIRGTSLFSAPGLTGVSSNSSALLYPAPTNLGNGDLVAFDWVNTSGGAFTESYLFGLIVPKRPLVVGKALRFPIGALVVTC